MESHHRSHLRVKVALRVEEEALVQEHAANAQLSFHLREPVTDGLEVGQSPLESFAVIRVLACPLIAAKKQQRKGE